MQFRVSDLLISNVTAGEEKYACAPATVCGTITNSGPNNSTCINNTACCHTGCGDTGCGQSCVGTIGVDGEQAQADDAFIEMMRREILEMQTT